MEARYEPRPGYLHVDVSGRFDATAALGVIANVARQCAEHRLDRVLVDFRAIADIVSIADRHALGRALASSQIPARIAILVAAPQRHTSALEDTAVNRGAEVCTTASEEHARRFLEID